MSQTEKSSKNLATVVLDFLASVKFAVSVVVIIAIACVAGTLLPQGADVARYLAKNPAASGWMELLGKLGLTDVFYAWWFIGLLCVLSVNVAACSMRRFAAIRRTTGHARGRAIGLVLTHISILLILAGGVIRGVWGEKGYLEFHEGETVAQFEDGNGMKSLPFALHLAKFEVETYADPKESAVAKEGSDCCSSNNLLVAWPEKNLKASLPIKLDVQQAFGDFRITVLKYIPDFVIDVKTKEVSSRSDEPLNPAILVAVAGPNYQNHRWLFAKFPDFIMHTGDHSTGGPSPLQMIYQNSAAASPKAPITGPIKQYNSTLKVIEDGKVVQEKTVYVNGPFAYKGYTFYQTGYNPEDLSYTSLQVVKDPGVPVVYAGFALMIVGLFIVFYLNPWLSARREQS